MSTNTTAAGRRVPPRLPTGALALGLGLAVLLAGCKQDAPPAQAPATPSTPAAGEPAQAPQAPAEAVSAEVAAMDAEQLREAASKAYQESRLYAPGGDNAMEYYLALRDKQPADAGVSSALVDLLPMTVIATEQSRDRGDFAEAKRLLALIEKTDSSYPAIERLKTTIASAEAEAARRAAQEQLTAEQEAQRQRELERQRQEQQRLAQEQAARELAAQQAAQEEAARQEAARQEAARQEAARREAERLEAERRQAEAARRAAPAATELRAISTPAPRYPPDALRSGTSGEVQVEFTVGVDGTVTAARVVQATPPRVFDREALNAVRRWRFEPVPAPVTSRRTINFAPSQ
ncbi:energy transducer TonB [Luteimonas wenzhouensis]|uniref:Protein TonB n=1 Tax=Luteimonas wenzhouensis TaxID=2599615 RepID=A0A5C5TWZ9_9GAMM|nr:energy transducer TonB [Luteimonas wenzhouensis]NLW97588.1 energy transducer TonB [Xanthomonadaceae bacterium]TWT18294.1 energy transducer TonB [Luteimonas wenzhouensis]